MGSQFYNGFHSAHTEPEVVEAVRVAVAQFRPEELARLPAKCRPGKIRDAEDVADLAYVLTKMRIAQDDSNETLIKLEAIFAHACQRLSAADQRDSATPAGSAPEARTSKDSERSSESA